MSEKDTIYKGKVKHSGIFDFSELYRFCYVWLDDEGYDITEKTYSEKVKPNGKEVEVKWYAKRKISDYFRFVIKADWRILRMNDAEVQKDGVKLKMNKGDLEIKFSAVLEKDYEHRWENTAFLKFLRGVYNRYIIKGRIDAYEDKIFKEVDEYIAEVKSFLALLGKHPAGRGQ